MSQNFSKDEAVDKVNRMWNQGVVYEGMGFLDQFGQTASGDSVPFPFSHLASAVAVPGLQDAGSVGGARNKDTNPLNRTADPSHASMPIDTVPNTYIAVDRCGDLKSSSENSGFYVGESHLD